MMTDRARQVYALLRTLLAWAPPPPASRTGVVLAQQPRGFAGGRLRYVTCPDCLANDHPEGMPGCETCRGRGEIPDPGPDPYDRGVAKGIVRDKISLSYRAADDDDTKRGRRERDLELRRLEFQLAKPEDKAHEQAIDPLTRAVEARDRLYRDTSYPEVWQQLNQLLLENDAAYHVAMTVAYQPFGEEPVEPVRLVVVAVCELIAHRIPGEIQVPAGVQVWTRDELEERSRIAKDALARGHNAWAAATRAERKLLIVALHGEGLTDGQIARRLGLTRQRVQQIRAGICAALEDAA